jgi:dTDP-4-dehydrorhamnose reductase
MKRQRLLYVTGSSGFLGRHIVNGVPAERWELVAQTSQALDFRNRESVLGVIGDWRPTVIIHTAYRKNDRSSNVDATRHVAEAASLVGSRLIHVSTDALFAGRSDPYTERDTPTPVHEYGREKAEAEQIVASLCHNAVVVRTSLLIGGNQRSGRQRSGQQLSGHEIAVGDAIHGRSPITFFTDEVRSPVLVDELAAALTDLAARPEITGVLHLGGPDPISRADLALMIARRHGWDTARLKFGTLAESGLSRPGHVVLDSSLAESHGLVVQGPSSWT